MKQNLLFACLFICFNAHSQKIITQADIGGSSGDQLISLFKTNDGSLIIAGNSSSNHSIYKSQDSKGDVDYWISKYSINKSTGRVQKLWDKTIGGDNDDEIFTCLPTKDNGYILAGRSMSGKSGDKTDTSLGFGFDYWLVKLNSNGKIMWDTTFGSAYNDNIPAFDTTNDGGFILQGSYKEIVSLIKLNSQGHIVFQRDTSGQSFGIPAIHQTPDGGYIGVTNNNPPELTKYDKKGNVLWTNTYPITYLFPGVRSSMTVQVTKDSGFVLYGLYAEIAEEGTLEGFHSGVYKIDSDGNLIWNDDNYLGYGNNRLQYSLSQTEDGGFIFGTSNYFANNSRGSDDYYYSKYNKEGRLYQDTIYGNSGDNNTISVSLSPCFYIIAGTSVSTVGEDKTKPNLGDEDIWLLLMKDTSSNVVTTASQNFLKKNYNELKLLLHPNPATNMVTVSGLDAKMNYELSIVNNKGTIVATKQVTGLSSYPFNVQNLSDGVYYVNIVSNEKLITVLKFVKQ